jgi:hypothetical protein
VFDRIPDAALPSALVKVALLASWDVLPALLLAYLFQSLLARRLHPEFALRKSEATELNRAVALYRTVSIRLNAIDERRRKTESFWRTVFAVEPEADRRDADEREDLKAHALHLCATITRLRRLPLQRLRSWVHTISMRDAFGRALAIHLAALTIFVVAFHILQQSASAHEVIPIAEKAFIPHAFNEALFQANAASACLAAFMIPMFYLLRRAGLHREFGLEFCVLKELAHTAPAQEAARLDIDPGDAANEEVSGAEPDGHAAWFTVLGVPRSATTDEVRQAYKGLIKQNHPDRVHDMSPAIRKFAEMETKRINAAYREALASLDLTAS